MTKQEWISYLDSIGAIYQEYDNDGELDQIYVRSKDEYKMKEAHPRKYKDLYIPYIRLSHFDDNRVYTRENGVTGYQSNDRVKRIIEKDYI